MNWRAVFLTTTLGVCGFAGQVLTDSAVVEFSDDTIPQYGTDAGFPRLEECPFEVKTAIEVVTTPTRPGAMRLKLTVVPKVECSDITVSIDNLDKLQCTSSLNWTFLGEVDDTTFHYIDLVVPASEQARLRLDRLVWRPSMEWGHNIVRQHPGHGEVLSVRHLVLAPKRARAGG